MMSGYDVNRFVELDARFAEDFKCSICLNIFNKAVVTLCGHTFCSQCIRTSIQTNDFICPQCRRRLDTRKRTRTALNTICDTVLSNNLTIDGIISKFKIKCDFEPNGCREVTELSLMATHLKTCEYNFAQIRAERNELIECKRKLFESELKCNELKARNACFEVTNNELMARKWELEAKYSQLEANTGVLGLRVKQLETNNSELNDKIKELEVSRSEIVVKCKEFAEKNRQLETKIMDLIKECNESLINLKDLKVKNTQFDVKNIELEVKYRDFELKNKELEAKNGEMEARIKQLSTDFKELELKSEEFVIKNSKIETKNRELDIKNWELEVNCREFETKNKKLEVKSREFDVKNREFETKCKEFEFNIWEFGEKCRELEIKCKDFENKCKELEVKSTDLELRNKVLEATSERLEMINREFKDQNSELEVSLVRTRTAFTEEIRVLKANKDSNSAAVLNTNIKTENKTDETMDVIDISEEMKFLVSTQSDYLLLGTYKTFAKTVEFTADAIKLTNVSPNSAAKTRLRFHIMIPYIEMKQLMYCLDPILPLIIVKPNQDSNNMIQESIELGSNSPNKFRFDINSNDPIEQYIIIGLKEKISEKLVRDLSRCSTQANEELQCLPIVVEKARILALNAKTRNAALVNNALVGNV